MMLLADTSVWVDHLRWPDGQLVAALEGDVVLVHPFVVGELACGSLRNRGELLSLLGRLPFVPSATHEEALTFVERHKLMGSGLGWVDVHLLASTALAGTAQLWTMDRRLAAAAAKLKLGRSHEGGQR
jgi:predicted nucleic acid-binding protein